METYTVTALLSDDIAAAIWRSHTALHIGRKPKAQLAGIDRALRLIASDLSATLANGSPGFDSAKFLAACGVQA